jgi:hypothetical protein
MEKISLEKELDTTNENFFSANNTSTSFSAGGGAAGGAGDENGTVPVVSSPPRYKTSLETDDTNGNFFPGAMSFPNDNFKFGESSSELESTTKEDDDDEYEEAEGDENVINASLIVNLSESSGGNAPFNFTQSFTTSASATNSSASASPLSSSRSAPPDLTTSVPDEFSEEDFPKLGSEVPRSRLVPFQTSTPLLRNDGNGDGPSPKLSTTPLTSKPNKKKNSVSWAETENIIPEPDTRGYEDGSAGEEETPETQSYRKEKDAEWMNRAVAGQEEEGPSEERKMVDTASDPDLESETTVGPASGTDGDGATASPDMSLDSSSVPLAPTLSDNETDEEVEEINKALPTTVTELVSSNGIKVYVVGTAHFSKQSHLDVIEVIK